MKKDHTYHDYVVFDLLTRFADISSRPMMSGWCIYFHKRPLAIIVANEFYLKAEKEFAEKMRALGSEPFSYTRGNGKVSTMKYFHVSGDILEDKERFEELVREAIEHLPRR